MHDQSLPTESLTLRLHDEDATTALGVAVARGLESGTVVHLRGDLGAGKTCVARGVLRGLDYPGRVKSPTYTLVELYKTSRLYLYHFDFYRLEDPHAWIDAGFREYFNGTAACLVEWPERAGAAFPRPDLEVHLEILPQGRDAIVRAYTAAGERCLSALRTSIGPL